MICRFVQFGADQDCYCGAIGCRQKLGSKPSKLKLSSSDTALQLVLCEMAASSPTVKALLYGKDVSYNVFILRDAWGSVYHFWLACCI